jgi:hypothetical protein
MRRQEVAVKALTLWQPYATLIALGHKRVETRSWSTEYRGPIAIHAAQREMKPDDIEELLWLGELHGVELPDLLDLASAWPLGKVVCTADLVDCREMTEAMIEDLSPLELDVGNWTPGRFAWVLENVVPLHPVAARGKQGLWDWWVSL